MFQFHKGSINTEVHSLYAMFIPMFQFHKGSINTNNFIVK